MASSNMNRPADRLTHIDLMECIGIFLVIYLHGSLYTYNYIVYDSLPVYLTTFLRAPLSMCVPIFFFANGYLLFHKTLDLRRHILRLIRMVVICFFWGSVLICVLQPIYGKFLTWEEFWFTLTNWSVGWANHLWYMGVLVMIHVFFPLLKQVYDSNRKIFYYFVAICAFFSFGNTLINELRTFYGRFMLQERMVYGGHNFNMFDPFKNMRGFAFVYFCVGGMVHDLRGKIEAIPARKRNFWAVGILVVSCIGLSLMCILFSRMNQYLVDVVWTGYDTVFTFVNVLCLYVLCLNWKKDQPLIRTISINTLGIYLLHVLPTWALTPYLVKLPWMCTFTGSFLFSVGILFSTLAVCLVLKKVPLVRKLL